MRSRIAALLLALAASQSAGCGWLTASSKEYVAYRKTRVERTFDQRIAAAHAYLIAYPNGAFAAELGRWFAKAEPVYFDLREKDEQGLKAYLDALPEGPHSAEVRSRLTSLRERRTRPDLLSVAAKSTEARLAAAAKSRERAHGELSFWIESLSDPDAYRSPMAEGPADLVVAFSLSLPAPVCRPEGTARSCSKEITVPYQVPLDTGGLAERDMAFTVTIVEDESGKPLSARIEGDEMFSRLEETHALRALDANSVDDRVAAVTRTVDVVTAAFQTRATNDPSCRKDVTVPDILHLECGGMKVIASAGTKAGTIDAVSFGPTGR